MPQPPSIDSLVDLEKATIDEWKDKIFTEKKISVKVLRLDKIHPVISGNKWFKLKNYLSRAINENKTGIISAGGTWSNHLTALAFACKELGIPSVGAIRGERPSEYSSTLKDLETWGMQLEFIPRDQFRDEQVLSTQMLKKYPGYLRIPMGGHGSTGIEGVKELTRIIDFANHDYLACAVGTGTFLTGLLENSNPNQQVLGICSLKASPDSLMIEKTVESFSNKTNFRVFYEYHFGGFGKADGTLIKYMNKLFNEADIPTDFIYTAKLFFAIRDLAAKDFFSSQSRVLVIHSGGLQGNRSLPVKTLEFEG